GGCGGEGGLGRRPGTPAGNREGGQCADADDRGTDPDRRAQSVDEELRASVATVLGEDRGQDSDAKDAAELPDRVVGARGLTLLPRVDRTDDDVPYRRHKSP